VKTELGKDMMKDYRVSALQEIERTARQRAEILDEHARTYESEAGCKIGAHFADAAKFERLADAIADLLADD
jgi:hypothetical protein